CDVAIVFHAAWSGADTATLNIDSNVPDGLKTVTLYGNAFVAQSGISVIPGAMSFGAVQLGTATSGRVVKISSTGTAPLVVALALTGANPGDYAIWADGCTGVSLNPGTYCTAYVSFEPNAAGARTAALTITHNAAGGSASVPLSGSGVKRGGYI